MKIQQTSLAMASAHQLSIQHERQERLKVWAEAAPPTEGAAVAATEKAESITLKPRPQDELKMKLVEKLLEMATGKRLKIVPLEATVSTADPHLMQLAEEKAAFEAAAQGEAALRQGWGMEYDYHESYRETEVTSFAAQGLVKTADGKEISISVQLNMSRQFVQEQNVSIREGDAKLKDPLVINFDGKAAELTDTRFKFDIDSDGEPDQISFLKPGSGFLALDPAGSGVVINGHQLFGTMSGDGFRDLAQYDRDGNGWIDAGDPIFNQLRIWTRDAQGHDRLLSLGEKGIGAIFVGHIPTSFDLKDGAQQLQGQVKRTGVFLQENGTAGTVQQIDLAV